MKKYTSFIFIFYVSFNLHEICYGIDTKNDFSEKSNSDNESCFTVEMGVCLSAEEAVNFEAIKSLHRLLDDDKSGQIDVLESQEFLKEELDAKQNGRQEKLHPNSDGQISVVDLWNMWQSSEVHNWTVEQTVEWLTDTVGMPRYVQTFQDLRIDGSFLPRMSSMNSSQYMSSELGIKALSHKTKLMVKAMDAVLFGPPKVSRLKDKIIAALVLLLLLGLALAYLTHRNNRMRAVHSSLIKQIDDLKKMEEELDKTKDKELGVEPLEPQLIDQKKSLDEDSSSDSYDECSISRGVS